MGGNWKTEEDNTDVTDVHNWTVTEFRYYEFFFFFNGTLERFESHEDR